MTTTERRNTHGGHEGSQSRSEPKEPPMTKTQDELLACPFCGGGAELNDYTAAPAAAWVLVHRHKTCPVAPQIQSFGSKDSALAAWNTRSPDPEVERLRGALERIAEGTYCRGDHRKIARAALTTQRGGK
jgi:hypothetical protein